MKSIPIRYTVNAIVTCAIVCGLTSTSFAQSKSAVVRELIELVSKRFSKEVAEDGSELVSRKIEGVVSKFGDDGAEAIRKLGPKAATLLDDAGEQSVDAARWLARFGDDATWVVTNPTRRALAAKYGDEVAEALIRHQEIAEPLIESAGKAAGLAFQSISKQNGRRLAMLASESDTAVLAKTPELLGVIAKYGDKGMDFIWRNKGVLITGAVLTAFIADPQPFLDGTVKLADVAVKQVAAPVSKEIAQRTNWTVIILTVLGIGTVYLTMRGVIRWKR